MIEMASPTVLTCSVQDKVVIYLPVQQLQMTGELKAHQPHNLRRTTEPGEDKVEGINIAPNLTVPAPAQSSLDFERYSMIFNRDDFPVTFHRNTAGIRVDLLIPSRRKSVRGRQLATEETGPAQYPFV